MIGVIMAGGEGSRLRPLTCDLPKPMVPLLGKPVMEYSIELLKKCGIERMCATLQYLPDRIMDHFGDGSEYGVQMHYFVEESPLGTAGSVGNARELLTRRTLIISGDALTDIDLSAAAEWHRQKGAVCTLVLKKVPYPLEYGVVIADENGLVQRFLEKPAWGEVFSDTVNTGIYILEPEILKLIPEGTFFDFSKDLFPLMMKKGIPIHGYVAEGYWCDIGDTGQYMQAQFDLLDGRVKVELPPCGREGNICLEQDVSVEEGVELLGPCYIGRGSRIAAGGRIGPYSIIGPYARLYGADIKRSVLWQGVDAQSGTTLRGSTVCSRVKLGRGVRAYEGSIIGADSEVGDGAELRPRVRIWPEKQVEQGSTVVRDVIWSDSVKKGLFGERGIRGVINTDLTPELAVALGGAYAFTMKKDIAIGYEEEKGGQMLANALAGGALSAGVAVQDAGQCSLPVLRYAVRHLGLGGGMYVERDGHFATLRLLDENGADIARETERKVENIFFRRDGKRCDEQMISYSRDLYGAELFYTRRLVREAANVREQPLTVGIGGEAHTARVFREILQALGCSTFSFTRGGEIPSARGDLGIVFEPDEQVRLFTHEGKELSSAAVKAIAYYLVTVFRPCGTVYLPVHETDELEGFIKGCGCAVERVKINAQDLMQHIWKMNVPSGEKELYFGIMYDPVEYAVRLISLLVRFKRSLRQIAAMMPASAVSMKRVPCPSRYKGEVIRCLAQQGDRPKELLDGVKIYHEGGWALILPENDQPVCRIYTHAFREEYGEELSTQYEDFIRKMTRE